MPASRPTCTRAWRTPPRVATLPPCQWDEYKSNAFAWDHPDIASVPQLAYIAFAQCVFNNAEYQKYTGLLVTQSAESSFYRVFGHALWDTNTAFKATTSTALRKLPKRRTTARSCAAPLPVPSRTPACQTRRESDIRGLKH